MRTIISTFAALAGIIAFAPDANQWMTGVLVIGTPIYGIQAGRTALNHLSPSADCTADNSGSEYGKTQAATNYAVLATLGGVVFGLIGLTKLYAIFS